MATLDKIIDEFKLGNSESGKITIATLKEPYGEDSESIVSIGIFLNSDGDAPNWVAHIPKSNIDDVIKALEKAKEEL